MKLTELLLPTAALLFAKPPDAVDGARAQPQLELEAYEEAAGELLRSIGEPGTRAELPGPDDPAYRRFSAQAALLTEVLGNEAYPVSKETFDTLCGPTSRVLSSYKLAGLQDIPKSRTDAETLQRIDQLIQRNLSRYFEQLFPLLVFSGHCLAVHIPSFEKAADALPPSEWTPERRLGMSKLRTGIFQTILGLVVMASDRTIGEVRQRKILKMLTSDATLVAPALAPDERQTLRDSIASSSRAFNDVDPAAAAKIMAAFEGRECNSLCSH